MSEMIVANYQRGIAEVTRDIRIKTGQFLMDAIEIGRLLFEAKSMVGPGGWMQYVAEELPFSHSWANNYMRLYKELGGEQISLFGNSQALANLSPTQALELLALPAEERDEFVQTHDVENMSTRELHQAIRDRDANLQAANEQAARAEKAEAEVDKLNAAVLQQADMLETKDAEAEELRKAADDAKAAQAEAVAKLEKLQAQLKKAKENEKAAKEALTKAKENPEIPEAMMEQMRQEVAADAAKKAVEDLQKQLDTATKEKQTAEKAAADAEQKLAAAQKQLQLSSPEAAVFKTLFTQVQEDFNRLQGALLKVQQSDPDTGIKLSKAVQTLLDKLREDIGS